jgi:hypothetical protein
MLVNMAHMVAIHLEHKLLTMVRMVVNLLLLRVHMVFHKPVNMVRMVVFQLEHKPVNMARMVANLRARMVVNLQLEHMVANRLLVVYNFVVLPFVLCGSTICLCGSTICLCGYYHCGILFVFY